MGVLWNGNGRPADVRFRACACCTIGSCFRFDVQQELDTLFICSTEKAVIMAYAGDESHSEQERLKEEFELKAT